MISPSGRVPSSSPVPRIPCCSGATAAAPTRSPSSPTRIADGVTEVARGADLADQCAVQAVLWRALGAAPPAWLHAPLILGGDGKKLSKSHRAAAVGDLREAGWSAGDVWRVVLPWLGLAPLPGATDGRALLHQALAAFDPARITRGPVTWIP